MFFKMLVVVVEMMDGCVLCLVVDKKGMFEFIVKFDLEVVVLLIEFYVSDV